MTDEIGKLGTYAPYTIREYVRGTWLIHGPSLSEFGYQCRGQDEAHSLAILLRDAVAYGIAMTENRNRKTA